MFILGGIIIHAYNKQHKAIAVIGNNIYISINTLYRYYHTTSIISLTIHQTSNKDNNIIIFVIIVIYCYQILTR